MLVFLAAVFSGIGWGLTVGFGLMQINQKVKERRGEVTSTYFTILYFGLIVPVIAVGLIASVIGLVTSGILFCGMVGITMLAVLVTVARS